MGKKIRNLNITHNTSSGAALISPDGLDKRVRAQVVAFLSQPEGLLSARRVVPSMVIQHILDCDTGLRRLKKSVVEKSVEVVLGQLAADERAQGEKVDAIDIRPIDVEGDLDDSNMMVVEDINALNKGIVHLWDTASSNRPLPDPVEIPDDPETGLAKLPLLGAPAAISSSDYSISIDRTSIIKESESQKTKKRNHTADNSSAKKWKSGSKEDRAPPTYVKLSDIGGMEHIIAEILEVVGMPLMHPEIYSHTGIQPPRGVLLHGPPGCGKTMLANALAGELNVPFISLSAPSVVSGMSGESEKKIREIFDEARSIAPCLIFLDEIDAITPKRESAQREMERRIVAQLLTCMDDLSLDKTDGKVVMVIGATNLPDSLDPALRRAGRFDREIQMSVPDELSRESILRVLCKKLRLTGDFDYKSLAKQTSGYVGADLNALTTAAGVAAIKRIFRVLKNTNSHGTSEHDVMDIDKPVSDEEQEYQPSVGREDEALLADIPAPQIIQHELDKQENSVIQQFMKDFPDPLTPTQLEPLSITVEDFLTAMPSVQPSSKREGFATIPDVTWESVGALQKVRVELQMAIVQPIRRPDLYAQVGITAPSGVLLWGPPGCGKTLLAKAVANESRANFISVRGPELLNKFVGESERALRQVFLRARASIPCVIFFDELDALVPRRDDSRDSTSRMVNTLLTELDGVTDRKGIFVIAATNRPDIIDPAMLRPGRLDKPLFVELPTVEERIEIFSTVSRKTPIDSAVDFNHLAADDRCRNFSGADIAALVREAAVCALRKAVFQDIHNDGFQQTDHLPSSQIKVATEDFEMAFRNVTPSVSDRDRVKYERLGREFGWQKD
ncbi:P-loop containing nucleoside triphosphate hydrolase protein [Lipomyces oligophaga]|uniref:P-loop containing nucleoside triphosphate hydrolase protein n=1 Tax=Lipomyces oligophaga TaxID=45792 RepID=UPI0034D00C4C